MTSRIATLSLALAALCALSTAFAADPPAAGGEQLGACKTDAEKLCPGIQPGEGRLKACFKEHRKDLSPDCKKELASARKARKG